MRGGLFHPDFPYSPKKLPFFYGWLIAFGSMMGTLFSIPGQTMGFSVFTEILMGEFQLSRVALSSAYFVGTVASGLTLPFAGRLFDYWGARRMIVLSAVATGLVLLFLSESADVARGISAILPESWRTGIAFVVIGLGFYLIRLSAQGILTMTSRNVVGKWFDIRRGLAMSLSGVFISFGFSVAPKVLDLLINRFEYDGAWRFLAILTLFVMAPLGWFIFRDNPEECGMEMDGPNVTRPTKENPDMVIYREYTKSEAVRTFSFHAFNLSFAFFAMYSTAYTFHIESLGAEFGFEKSRIINLFIPMAAISVTTNLFFGWINSKTRLKYMLLIMNLGALLGTIGLYKLGTDWGVPAYVIGTGITGGVFSSLAGVVWPRFYGRKWLGSISGIAMSSMVIASGVGPWLFAVFFEFTGSYELILIICIALPATLCVGSLFADNPQRKVLET
ncbi:MAG: MFS transporter [Verrucomicrobiales bacterium]|nr:MFS transporter [Verrucomicrobiales bacterium]